MNGLDKNAKFPVLLPALFLLLLTAASVLRASERLPFNTQVKRLIQDTFYKDGQPSTEKIDRYRSIIDRRYREVKKNLVNVCRYVENKSKKKTDQKIENKSEIKAYEILLDFIDQLSRLKDPAHFVEFQRLALSILRLDYALKIQARKLASVELIEKIPFSLTGKKIPIRRAPKGEASNLVNPGTGLFYSQDELLEIKRRGGDVSKLNPPSDSTF